MKRFLASIALWFSLALPALAQLITPASMRDANLATTSAQNLVTTLNTFTAQRTLTIPGSGGLSSYYFQFVDAANAINGSNTLRIVAADGSNINGASALVVTTQGAYVFIIPSPFGYAASVIPPSASAGSGITQLTGDVTAGPGSSTQAATLAVVNANVGAFGSNVQCSIFTVNAKGLITAASQSTCTPAIGSVTGLGTGIATALAVNIGSAGAPVLFNGAGGTPSSMVGTNITGTASGLTAGTANAVAVGNITGAGAGCITWLTTPSSANLRGCLTDETGTGLAYFQGGALGTPASGTATNLTGYTIANLAGAGTGVLTALGNNTNSSGGFPTQPVANSSLANSAITLNGTSTALGASYTTISVSSNANNPTAITSNTQKMLGLSNSPSFSFTPTASGVVMILIQGSWNNNTVAATCTYNLRTGTGTAPINGATATGSALNTYIYTAGTAAETIPISDVVITPLSPGTTYWTDLSVASSGASTCTFASPSILVWER